MRSTILFCLASLLLATALQAEGPRLISYQGILTDLDGNPINEQHRLTFTLYPDTSGSPASWTEEHLSVDVADGLFNVILGANTTFPAGLFETDELWLGIAVDDDDQMAPRTRMTSVPWAMRATVATYADSCSGDGIDSDWTIDGDDMYSAVAGNVGIGETAPLTQLHVQGADRTLTDTALFQEELVVEDSDAFLGLYSSTGGSFGSGISLGELSEGALTNKWSIVRTTGETSQLQFRFGSNSNYSDNSTAAAMWRDNDSSILRLVSTGSTGALLKLRGSEDKRGAVQFIDGNDVVDGEIYYYNALPLMRPSMRFRTSGTARMSITSSGDVGIGTMAPERLVEVSHDTDAHLRVTCTGSDAGYLELKTGDAFSSYVGGVKFLDPDDSSVGLILCRTTFSEPAGVVEFSVGGNEVMELTNDEVRVHDRLRAPVLELTGGADFSERFDVTTTRSDEPPAPGSVVCIDPSEAGRLIMSHEAYDRKVAGIISGAGGIEPGVLMGQKGSIADGAHPVALTGRVYCKATASNGPIQPGDLLTTSNEPGHAMKVTDHARSQGAILGKAMTSLDDGQGLVLVLVSLQ